MTRKVRAAVATWRQHPTEIEAGIRAEYPGVRIAQWFRGEMSSRELLVMIKHLPADGDYQKAKRASGESEGMELLRDMRNELFAFVAGHKPEGERTYTPAPNPKDREAFIAEAIEQQKFEDEGRDELMSGLPIGDWDM